MRNRRRRDGRRDRLCSRWFFWCCQRPERRAGKCKVGKEGRKRRPKGNKEGRERPPREPRCLWKLSNFVRCYSLFPSALLNGVRSAKYVSLTFYGSGFNRTGYLSKTPWSEGIASVREGVVTAWCMSLQSEGCLNSLGVKERAKVQGTPL